MDFLSKQKIILASVKTKTGDGFQENNLTARKKDRRSYIRIPLKLKITIGDLNKRNTIKTTCINISFAGVGIKVVHRNNNLLYIDNKFSLWIDLFDGLKPMHHFCRLVWLNKDMVYDKCGIVFLMI